MTVFYVSMSIGAILAIALCWNLGRIYFIPMILNFASEFIIPSGLLQYVDVRWYILVTGFLYVLWVMILTDVFRDWFDAVTIYALVIMSFMFGMYPAMEEVAADFDRSVEGATRVLKVGMVVVFGQVLLAVLRSIAKLRFRGGMWDMIVNPRKRFLIPIGLWSGICILPVAWIPGVGDTLETYRYVIASHALWWGWVLLELKFFFQARYWRRRYGN
ncbi:hypothetical protein IT157_01000 [bacterium]|nr:hypothetical protein [bacterium]